MEQFWLWFIRPFAEFLGVLAVFVGIFSFYVGWMLWEHFKKKLKELKKRFEESL